MDRRKILAFALGPVLGAALGFISIPLTAWYFPPEDIGRNNVFQIFSSFSILLCILGLDQAYVREFHETKDRFSLFKACFIPGLILLLLMLAATLPFAGEIARMLYGESKPAWYLITIGCVILSFMGRFFSLVVRMQERGLAYSTSQVLPKLAVITVLVSYLVFGAEKIYSNLLYANFVSASLVVLVFGWNTRTDWLPAATAKVNRTELKKLLHFGFPLIGAGVAYWGLTATSTITLRTFSDFKELGIYSMAMSFGGVAIIFQSIFSTIWMPTVYKWVAKNQDLNRINMVTRYVQVVICFIFTLAGMLSWMIDYVLPPDYKQVKYIVVCCMAQPLLYTLSETTVVGLNIQRKSMYALGIAILALACNVLFSVLLVPRFGAAGAAVSNALAYFVFFTARTEASVWLWRSVPRGKLYASVVLVLMLSIITALIGQHIAFHYSLVWLMLAVALVVWFKKEIIEILSFVGGRRSLLDPKES
jgi:O-antigen/teichoic acid export membrane protein